MRGSSASDSVIRVQDLVHVYPRSAWQLGPLSFEVRAGGMTGLIGPNGSGKSTLLAACARHIPARGSIHVFRRPIATYGAREWARLVAYLPQSIQAQFDFTVEETVAFGRYPHTAMMGFLDAHDWAVIQRCMEQAELSHLRTRRLSELSGGERQRVHLAAVLAQEPRLMLLDEPATALDIHHQVALYRILRECTAAGITVVLATHDLSLAAHFCDELMLLSGGQIAAQGSPDRVITEPLIHQVYGAQVRVVTVPGSVSPAVVPALSLIHISEPTR
ncbi:MAG: ABC transporter ATP-binding protein, partial [bacterium]|nr:ABC transporter ATP-binding protein [bacterium]